MERNTMWYDYSAILSHNCIFNIIIGDRGGGKTYGAKKLVLKEFIKNKGQFVWLRRYKEELKPKEDKGLSPMLTFFNDLIANNEFPDHEFSIKNSSALVDGEEAGYFTALNGQSFKKSVSLPNVKYIIFDEFLIDDRQRTKYLPDEVNSLLSLLDTIIRLRTDVKVILLGNALSFNNPYMSYFNIKPFREEFKKIKEKSIVVHLWHNEALKEAKLQTDFGRLISGTDYANMAIENQFYMDNNNFVEKFKTNNLQYRCTVRYNKMNLGIWYSKDNRMFYINDQVNMNFPLKYVLTNEEQEVDWILCKSLLYSPLPTVKEFARYSRVRYSTQQIKYIFQEVLSLV